MKEITVNNIEQHNQFLTSSKEHILMITNHGVHEWHVVPGLPDTGGQNVFVNQFTESLTSFGYRVTIVNRGGYKHPARGEWQRGMHYKDKNQRILYIEDKSHEFVRKEDMHEHIPALVQSLRDQLSKDAIPVDMIISHYWDGALIGVHFNNQQAEKSPHIWVPHSLGTLKKQNVKSDQWSELRIDERIDVERNLIEELDAIAATSSTIRNTLELNYGYTSPDLFLPPCVDTERIYPRDVDETNGVWEFLSTKSNLSPQEIRECLIISEISRTDTTKRKDILIKAFESAHKSHPNSLLVLSIDDKQQPLANELRDMINQSSAAAHIIEVGSIWDILPTLYAVSDIYCTPSVMEGFGMSAQEAAATQVPIIASNLVPFVVEYLLGSGVEDNYSKSEPSVKIGKGAIVVQADDIRGFTIALDILLKDATMRKKMGKEAYQATIPYFTWGNMVSRFLSMVNHM